MCIRYIRNYPEAPRAPPPELPKWSFWVSRVSWGGPRGFLAVIIWFQRCPKCPPCLVQTVELAIFHI